jgi:hypothetical protein
LAEDVVPRSRPSFPKLAALGALGASAGLALLLLVFIWYTIGDGGMDGVTTAVAWISVGGLILGLIAVHVVFAKKLMEVDRESGRSD